MTDLSREVEIFRNRNIYREWNGNENHEEGVGQLINSGLCGEFADFVLTVYDGNLRRMSTADVIGVPQNERPEPWHVWVTNGNMHFDAECPTGVESWTELPYFKRNL